MSEVCVSVRHSTSTDPCDGDVIECIVGTHLKIDPSDIQDFSHGLLKPVEQDLILLVAAVAFADRRVARQRSTGWSRTIRLSLPVSNTSLWSSNPIKRLLRDTLSSVSGDHWALEFKQGFIPIVEQQSSLDFGSVSDVVIPFSDGMDSAVQWHLQSRGSMPKTPLRVHSRTGNQKPLERLRGSGGSLGSGVRLTIPFRLRLGNHPEPSYRTRTFVFFTLAALAGARLGLKRVLIGENGISTLGPPLVPYGNEHRCLGTHPSFTIRLAEFLNTLLEKELVFEHPQLFRTKGSMLKRADDSIGDGILGTHSCVRDSRAGLRKEHCGVCCGCLLRRVALHAVGKRDVEYAWDDLSASSLAGCKLGSVVREQTKNDEDIAYHGIHIMQSVAELGQRGSQDVVIQRCARELAACDPDRYGNCVGDVRSLFEAYRGEWEDFKNQFGQGSLLRCYERT